MVLEGSGVENYSLNLKCPLKVYVLKAPLPIDQFLQSNWILRIIPSPVGYPLIDSSEDTTIERWWQLGDQA